jgi:S-disulfanyl-L-cysteine oxidoreductase SoxD
MPRRERKNGIAGPGSSGLQAGEKERHSRLSPFVSGGGIYPARSFSSARIAVLLVFALASLTFAQAPRVGKPAPGDLIKALDITTFPDGRGLPPGNGTVAKGKDIFKEKCSVCHNDKGEGREGQYPALVGGVGSLNTPKPIKTVGSYWPFATTIFDYVRRAMPYDQPGTLKPDEIYSAVAFILNANGIIGDSDEINSMTLPKVKMPNRDGFIADKRPDVKAKR